MGEVWRARHRLLVRPAAVKLIRRDALSGSSQADPERVLRRFEREAQATAQLRSPHSVQLYDFGFSRDGGFFYVMELLDGITLETLVQRFGPLPAERTVFLLRQVCQSLEEAHYRGLLHRDIKPANIFCCRQGLQHDFVKVLDFGLVKAFGDLEAGSPTRLTADGAVTGTPAYMAPEAVLGDEELGPAADLYAIGCVAYWLLTGQVVFDAPSPVKLALLHMEKTPEPPSRATELPIPEALDRLVLDLLAKKPSERPPGAAEVIERLDAIPFPEPWTAARARAWWRKHLPEVTTETPRVPIQSVSPLASTADGSRAP
jgi:serine/threonine-protein kinase